MERLTDIVGLVKDSHPLCALPVLEVRLHKCDLDESLHGDQEIREIKKITEISSPRSEQGDQ